MKSCTVLLFSTGQFRIMGKASSNRALKVVEQLKPIYSDINTPLYLVSQTISFQLDTCICPINLYEIAHIFTDDRNITFEAELFPALCLHYWKPLHVNTFSNGKVVILGKNAIDIKHNVEEWIILTWLNIIHCTKPRVLQHSITLYLEDVLCPVDLNAIASSNKSHVHYNPNLYPALSIHYWSPVQVSLFSNGKVIILGEHASLLQPAIISWITMECLLV